MMLAYLVFALAALLGVSNATPGQIWYPTSSNDFSLQAKGPASSHLNIRVPSHTEFLKNYQNKIKVPEFQYDNIWNNPPSPPTKQFPPSSPPNPSPDYPPSPPQRDSTYDPYGRGCWGTPSKNGNSPNYPPSNSPSYPLNNYGNNPYNPPSNNPSYPPRNGNNPNYPPNNYGNNPYNPPSNNPSYPPRNGNNPNYPPNNYGNNPYNPPSNNPSYPPRNGNNPNYPPNNYGNNPYNPPSNNPSYPPRNGNNPTNYVEEEEKDGGTPQWARGTDKDTPCEDTQTCRNHDNPVCGLLKNGTTKDFMNNCYYMKWARCNNYYKINQEVRPGKCSEVPTLRKRQPNQDPRERPRTYTEAEIECKKYKTCPASESPICAVENDGYTQEFSSECAYQNIRRCKPDIIFREVKKGECPKDEESIKNNKRIMAKRMCRPDAMCPHVHQPLCAMRTDGREVSFGNSCQFEATKNCNFDDYTGEYRVRKSGENFECNQKKKEATLEKKDAAETKEATPEKKDAEEKKEDSVDKSKPQ